ncbi:MAG: DUF4173 domain-containing protein, partial [Actinomycetota bacterium]
GPAPAGWALMGPGGDERDSIPARPDRASVSWWEKPPWRSAIIVSLFGLFADRLVRSPVGLGLAISILAGVIVVAVMSKPGSVAMAFLGAGSLVGCFVAVRSNPTLLWLNLGTAAAFVSLGAGSAARGTEQTNGVRAYIRRAPGVVKALPDGCAMVAGPPFRAIASSRGGLRTALRLAVITLPVVAMFVVLLASADAVFAHYLAAPFRSLPSVRTLPQHIVMVAACTLVLATFLARAATPLEAHPSPPVPRGGLRRSDWVLLLSAVDLLFAGFVAVQFSSFFGSSSRVITHQGLTFAEYARSGFAQLVVAVLLTGALVTAVWFLGEKKRDSHGRTYVMLAGTLVVLSLIVLASAFRRLIAYEGAFGWTWPRLEVHLTIVFLAVVLVCALIAIVRRNGTWLPSVAIFTAVVMLVGLNVMNPDRFIAERNITRFRATGAIDISELAHMSPDATPLILEAMPALEEPDRLVLQRALGCQEEMLRSHAGAASWNYGRRVATRELQAAGLDGCI